MGFHPDGTCKYDNWGTQVTAVGIVSTIQDIQYVLKDKL